MLQVGLCDDEPVLLDTLEEKVRRCFSENLIFAEIQAFTGGQNLLYEAEDGKRFDLLLLDIEMPGMDGLELASRLRQLLPDALLIFITSHVEFALDAYELSTFRYIPKNNMDGRLEHALLDGGRRHTASAVPVLYYQQSEQAGTHPAEKSSLYPACGKEFPACHGSASLGKYREKRRRGAHGIQGKENPPGNLRGIKS